MAKPPETPPHSDLEGVHQDGTRPGKVVRHDKGSGKELADAHEESHGRPEHSDERR